jgi:hypothetical protein
VRLSSEEVRRLIHYGIALGFDPNASVVERQGRRPFRELQCAYASWWNQPNVVGFCFARKLQRGALGPPTLQVLVREKLPKKRLRPRHRVPEELEGHLVGKKGLVTSDVRGVGKGRL